jgi:hypothetical protein
MSNFGGSKFSVEVPGTCTLWCTGQKVYSDLLHIVCKMDLILRSIQQRPQMQFSMARKFTLRPLHKYDVNLTKKTHKSNLTLDAPCLEKLAQVGIDPAILFSILVLYR